MQIQERDPIARTSVERRAAGMKVYGGCRWCGTLKTTLYSYVVIHDGGKRNILTGLFCNKGCRDAYHGK